MGLPKKKHAHFSRSISRLWSRSCTYTMDFALPHPRFVFFRRILLVFRAEVSDPSGPGGENSQSQKWEAGRTHRPTERRIYRAQNFFSSIFPFLPWCIAIHPCEKENTTWAAETRLATDSPTLFPKEYLVLKISLPDKSAIPWLRKLSFPSPCLAQHTRDVVIGRRALSFRRLFFRAPRTTQTGLGNENTRHSAPLLTQTHAYVTTNIHVGLLVQISHTYSPSIQKRGKRRKETHVYSTRTQNWRTIYHRLFFFPRARPQEKRRL